MATSGKNFSNLSKFTTPELSVKREGAKPFDRNLQRRESFGLASPPFQDASQFNFDRAYQDPQNLTNQLPQQAPQMATSTRSGGNKEGASGSGNLGGPEKKVFRSEVHREPVRIPVKVLQADGTERMLPNNGPLDIEGMKKRMADQMASMGFGQGMQSMGFDKAFPNVDSIFNMGPVPMRKRSSGPEGKPVKIDVQKPGATPGSTPPKTFSKPPVVHVSQKARNHGVNSQAADDTASMETASEMDNNDLGNQIKNSPPVPRKNTPYHNQRRNSLKITPEVGEAALLAEIARTAQEKENGNDESANGGKKRSSSDDSEVSKPGVVASEEASPQSKDGGDDNILAEKFLKLNQDILKISYDLCSIHPNFDGLDEAALKKVLKQVLGYGESLMRILFSLDGMEVEGNRERISKKILSSVGNHWLEKSDSFENQIRASIANNEGADTEQSHIDC